MEKIVVTRGVVGIAAMQVCCEKDATDKEIIEVCNSVNPSGTSSGWSQVIREHREPNICIPEENAPVQCADDPNRLHMLVIC